jgi:hypothetical protein
MYTFILNPLFLFCIYFLCIYLNPLLMRLYLFHIYFLCTLFVPIAFYKCEWCNMYYLYCIVSWHWMRLTCLLTGIWVSSGGCLSHKFLLFYGLVPTNGWSICFDNWHNLYPGLWTCCSTCNWIYLNNNNNVLMCMSQKVKHIFRKLCILMEMAILLN